MVQQSRRLDSLAALLWEPQICHYCY